MAALGFGSSGPEVERLQQRLKAAGFFFGTVDGRYGTQTFAAVKRFQQSAGLVVDGIAGPRTLAALDGLGAPSPAPQPPGTGRAMSLHIGIDRVDPARYGGWDGALSGCERDARTMTDIARMEGFPDPRQLFTRQATSGAILAEIRRAAGALEAGGTFLLTYAGHGGQAADPTGDEETDQLDETWVAYDRQILDDELEQVFAEFAAGVHVVVVSDSCHSGTVHRAMPPMADGTEDAGSREQSPQYRFAELKQSFYRDLALPRPGPGEPLFEGFPRPAAGQFAGSTHRATHGAVPAGARAQAIVDNGGQGPVFAPAPLPATGRGAGGAPSFATRNIPLPQNETANDLQRQELAEAKQRARSRGPVRAAGVLLAGCADNQLSQEVGGAGVFTTALSRIWAANGFAGTYQDLIEQVVTQMGPTQTPALSTFGTDPHLLVAKTPFDLG